jgi:hypothetical protein
MAAIRWGMVFGILACSMAGLALAPGCSRMARPETAGESGAFRKVESRLEKIPGVEGRGTASFTRANQAIEIPFNMSISEDLVINLDAEVRHFLIPFEGTTTLVSSEERSVVSTPIGVFDLGRMGHSHSAVRAALLSALAGGDGLLLWVKSQRCEVARRVDCGGLTIRMEPDETGYFIDSWEVKALDGTTFKASVDDLEPGPDRLPRSITGIVLPDGIGVDLEFDRIRSFDEQIDG